MDKQIKRPEAVFNFSNNYWKNKIIRAESSEDKLDIAGRFAGIALNAFIYGADHYDNPKDLAKLLNILDKQATWIVVGSDGIQAGYRLVNGWFRIILAQMVLHGAEEAGTVEATKENISRLWASKGWDDIEDCLEPKYDNLRTVQEVTYPKDEIDGELVYGTLNIILEPTGEFPVGAKFRTKKGTEWEVNEIRENSLLMQAEEPPYQLKDFGINQVRDWERIL